MTTAEIQQRIDRFRQYGQSLPQGKVYFREDWETIYFDLLGKQFGLMSPLAGENALITLKNDPEQNEELRELYPGIIIPGYYANKKHWNSIKLASSELTDSEIEQMIKKSYQLVLKKLTKKQQKEILSLREEDETIAEGSKNEKGPSLP